MIVFQLVVIVLVLYNTFENSPIEFHDEDFLVFSLVNLFNHNSVINQLN